MNPPRLSIAIIAATALAYEILLMRLFAIIQWHHFAYMIISLALLGYGVSGTFLSLLRRWLLNRFAFAYMLNLLLFGMATVVCYLLIQRFSFNPQEVFWDPWQLTWLMLSYLLLALPFFFVANCIGLTLLYFPRSMTSVYGADLVGAGLGGVLVIGLLFMVFPHTALLLLGSLIFLAGGLAWYELVLRPRWIGAVLCLFLLLPWSMPADWTRMQISPYKGLSQLLQISGTDVVKQLSSPLGLLSIVESPQIPLRHAPGLSLRAQQWPPEQKAVFTDADGMTAITRYSGDLSQLAYLDQLTSALPYHLAEPEGVLVLGTGGGSGVLQARYHGAPVIDAVELNPQLGALLLDEYADFSGQLFAEGAASQLHIGEARGFVTSLEQDYDLIQIALLDSYSASSAGLYALSEGYLYTVEALQEYMGHLTDSGYLAISRWVRLPPRDTLKLFATAVQALESQGVKNPGEQLMLIRSWQTSSLLIKRTPFTSQEIKRMRSFCRQRSFDVAYYPGISADEANRYNILEQAYFFTGSRALLGAQRDSFMQNYKFRLQPATDNQPYFFHFFKWRSLPEMWQLRGQGGLPLVEMGYPILVVTLVQAVLASLVLILLPLLVLRRRDDAVGLRSTRHKSLLYFSMLGLAFLFIEMAFIQRFILFLHHPLYAVSVVLAAFLLFAGIGSAYAKRFQSASKRAVAIRWAIGGIVLLATAYLWLLEPLFSSLISAAVIYKILLSIILIAPLGFSMGIPFPLGLEKLNELASELTPWAWGINGCASVISTVLASLLAIHLGFAAVVLFAVTFYLIAAFSIP